VARSLSVIQFRSRRMDASTSPTPRAASCGSRKNRDFLQHSNSIVAPEDVKTISRRSDNKRGVSLCARPRHFVNLAGEARMVLGPRLLERKTLTCFALAMMVTAMLHGDDDADDPMDWDDDGDGLGLEMIIVPILLILLRLAEKDTFAWVKRRNRTIDSFSDEEAKAFFRFKRTDLHRLLIALAIPERIVLPSRCVVSGEVALLVFLARLTTPGGFTFLLGFVVGSHFEPTCCWLSSFPSVLTGTPSRMSISARVLLLRLLRRSNPYRRRSLAAAHAAVWWVSRLPQRHVLCCAGARGRQLL
jgi:hypothetical protein